jgi:hypothetical protein
MNKKILIALLSLTMLTAAKCEGVPQDLVFTSPKCGSVTGFTFAYLKYGDGLMGVLPVTRVREGRVFVILLDPESGFRNADVTISGTGESAWISGSGSYNGLPAGTYRWDGMLEAGCAPPLPDDLDRKEYKYMIEVHDTASGVKNTLDPLVRVEQ